MNSGQYQKEVQLSSFCVKVNIFFKSWLKFVKIFLQPFCLYNSDCDIFIGTASKINII